MVSKQYVPESKDLIWLAFNSAQGHEQKGRRPALVISASSYNNKTNLALVCPITSKRKGYYFEVELESEQIKGVVLADQIKSLDWKVRDAKFIEEASDKTFQKVTEKLNLLINS